MPPVPPLAGEDHVCDECDISFRSVTIDAAVDAIRGVPALLDATVLTLTEVALRQRPDDRTWSPLEYVCHIRDVYAVYTIRLYRTRVEHRPTLEPMLNDLRVVRFRYNQREIGAVLGEVADNVAGFIDETTRFSGSDWDRVATRLPGEERTARWLVRQAMHEGTHHLRDVETVLRRVAEK